MKAVILAAGVGSRLEPLTSRLPKCLVPVAGISLLDRMIARIEEVGIREIIVVTGHMREVLETHVRTAESEVARRAALVFNGRYAEWGNFYSLLVAREAIGTSDFIKFDADVLLDADILPKLLAAPGPAVLAVERREGLGPEEMKARIDASGRIVELNKRMSPAVALGESIGVERIDAAVAPALFQELAAMIERGETHEYYERAYEVLMQQGVPFSYADITGSLWCEVDNADDLAFAHDVVAQQKTTPVRV